MLLSDDEDARCRFRRMTTGEWLWRKAVVVGKMSPKWTATNEQPAQFGTEVAFVCWFGNPCGFSNFLSVNRDRAKKFVLNRRRRRLNRQEEEVTADLLKERRLLLLVLNEEEREDPFVN